MTPRSPIAVRARQLAGHGSAILKLGSRGNDVLRVQARLRANGHSVPLSGLYDEETAGAVREFQAGHLDDRGRPLDVDGKIAVGGRATWWALLNRSERRRQQPGTQERAECADVAPEGDRRRVLRVAMREVGVREEPDGSNGGPRVDVYTGRWRVPWCALFVSWAIRQALGRPAFPPHAGLASVRRIARWASEAGAALVEPAWPKLQPDVLDGVSDEPLPGDVFLMLAAGGADVDAGRGHCGFVLTVERDRILTIEGNCANAVRSRLRRRSTIAGYARLVT